MIRIKPFFAFFIFCFHCSLLLSQIPPSLQNEINSNDENAVKFLNEGNLAEAAKFYNQSAFLLRNNQLNEQAAVYYEKIIDINKQLNNQKGLLLSYNNLGMLYLDIENYEKALVNLEKGLELSKKIDTKEAEISCITNIAVALQGLGRYQESNKKLEAAVQMSKDINNIKLLRRCYGILYENYDKTGQSDKSYQYFELYSTLDKEIKKREMHEVKEEAETKVNVAHAEKELTEAELRLKKEELEITTDSLVKVEKLTREQQLELEVKEKEIQIKDAQLKLEKIRKNFALIALGITLVFIIVLAFLLVKLRIANKKIVSQRDILDRQNKNITSSIRYAMTIQQAMLPDQKILEKYFDLFIIFKPKDIVSGDFYWFSGADIIKENKKFFFALVDCTGHGVPGAFMSMIGNRLLSEIVNERKVEDPKEVLELLNNEIKIALHQEQTDNNDGMDLSFCSFEKVNSNKTKLVFSGAKRSVYIIKNETGEFIQLKGERKSIGGLGEKKEQLKFTNQEFILSGEDCVYFSTDGLIDQNGPDRKRFGSKRFEDFLISSYKFSIQEQKEKLEKEITGFMQNEEQRDDIALIGLKIK